jgi:hypothetical protein
MFECAGDRVENGFAPCTVALESALSEVPGAIAYVGGEDISTKPTEALRMDDVESAINLEGHGQGKAQHRCERIRSPGRDRVEMNASVIGLNPVGKDMDFMISTEPRRQFRHITALATGTVVIMHDEGDPH